MSNHELRIDSYFSLPTDLAVVLGSWPEFVSGRDYDVELRSGEEVVVVRLAREADTSFLLMRGQEVGSFFHRVLGAVVHALSANSDSVWVTRSTG